MKQDYIEKILDADMVLVGIGSEFEKTLFLKEERAVEAIRELGRILQDKNYFFITTCTNGILKDAGLKEGRIVSPCGNMEMKQCPDACADSLQPLTDKEKEQIGQGTRQEQEVDLGHCAVCGKPLVLNNVLADKYDENGYLPDWSIYTKWLQGTLNRKLCILELGVNLTFPSIIRWPFEKVAFYNQKASFFRVNEKLYHMSEELKDKGISISKNAIDWLLEMDI